MRIILEFNATESSINPDGDCESVCRNIESHEI